MMKKTPAIVLLITTSILLSSCLSEDAEKPPAAKNQMPPAVVLTQKPVAGVMQETIEVVGTLTAKQQAMLRAEIAGQIISIKADDGKKVAANEALLFLDKQSLQATVQKMQAQLSLAEQEKRRLDKLFKRNAVSQYEVDKAEAEVLSAKADLDLAQTQMKKATIRAPFSGVLGIFQISQGDYVQPAQRLVELSNINELYVDFPLPETLLGKVKKGSEVEFFVPSLKRKFTAKVLLVSPMVNSHTGTVQVRAIFNNQAQQIKPGVFIKVLLPVTNKQEVLWLPEKALFISAGKQTIVVNDNGKALHKPVTVVSYQNQKIAISEGITADDEVVTAGHHKAPFSGMPLMVSPQQQAAKQAAK